MKLLLASCKPIMLVVHHLEKIIFSFKRVKYYSYHYENGFCMQYDILHENCNIFDFYQIVVVQ